MEVVIKDKTLTIGDNIFCMEDMDSKEVEDYFRTNIGKYQGNCEIANEVFVKYAHLFRTMEMLIDKYGITSYKIEKNADKVLVAVFKDAFGVAEGIFLDKVVSNFYFFFWSFSSYIYMLIKMLIGRTVSINCEEYDGFFVSRTKADVKMINVLKNERILQSFDNFNDEKSFYRLFGKLKRLKIITLAYIKCFMKKREYFSYVLSGYGVFTALDAVRFYSKRVVHTNAYKLFVHFLSKKFETKTFYTADNLDRFAIIQESIAKGNGQKLICIPHGIEYGFVLPHCFVGDLFYATSENACQYLNNMYNTKKFVFDYNIAKKMFDNNAQCVGKRKIVYFSEPRESYVNVEILEQIIPFIKENGLTLNLKLHPKDKIGDYEKIINDVQIIESIDEAIVNSICIARKSTVLIEALYNNSDSIAILINNKDKEIYETFPSLNDDRIHKTFSVQELNDVISKLIDKLGAE